MISLGNILVPRHRQAKNARMTRPWGCILEPVSGRWIAVTRASDPLVVCGHSSWGFRAVSIFRHEFSNWMISYAAANQIACM